MYDSISQSFIDSAIEGLPYIGKVYKFYNIATDYIDYINVAASDISLPENYTCNVNCFVKNSNGASRITSNFELCRLYLGYSTDYSFIFYEPSQNYIAYDDLTSIGEHISTDLLSGYPFDSHQIGNYALILYFECPSRGDFQIETFRLSL